MVEESNPAESGEGQRDNVRNLFDDRAEQYFHERDRDHGFVVQKDIVLGMFDKDGGKVLDIGCGPAVMADDLLKRGCTFWGIDVSEKMISLARARMESHRLKSRAHFSVGDIENLEFPDDFFDAVLCMGVLEYLSDDSPAIEQMSRVLRPGGTLIVTTPSEICVYQAVGRLIGLASGIRRRLRGRRPEPITGYTRTPCIPRELDRKLMQSGIRKVESASCNAVLWPGTRLLPNFPPALTRKLEGLCRFRALGWLGTQYIVKGEKRGASHES